MWCAIPGLPFLVSPREIGNMIGNLEELRELELPGVGRRIGETFCIE